MDVATVRKLQGKARRLVAPLAEALDAVSLREALVTPLVFPAANGGAGAPAPLFAAGTADTATAVPFTTLATVWTPWLDACAERWPDVDVALLDALGDAASADVALPHAGMQTLRHCMHRKYGLTPIAMLVAHLGYS